MNRPHFGLGFVQLPPNRPDCELGFNLRGMFGGKKFRHTRHVSQEFILVAEHSRRPNNCRSWESFLDQFLCLSFGLVEFGRRGFGGIEVRNLNELRYSTFRSYLGNPSWPNGIGRPNIKIPVGVRIFQYPKDKAQTMSCADLVS